MKIYEYFKNKPKAEILKKRQKQTTTKSQKPFTNYN